MGGYICVQDRVYIFVTQKCIGTATHEGSLNRLTSLSDIAVKLTKEIHQKVSDDMSRDWIVIQARNHEILE